MRNVVGTFVLLSLALAIAMPLSAQDAKKKRKGPQVGTAIMKKLAKVELTDEQKKKIDDIIAENQPKFAEAHAKISREARRAMNEAKKKAREEGKKGKDLQAAGDAVLDEEQKAAQAKITETNRAVSAAIIEVLTDDQLLSAGLKRPRRNKKAA